ncbi:MAG: triose-phosphate isomerase [Phycisphaerales bacterium]|nr:triose-phosphate isomerase [Phycisphaerales bacterium]
MMAARRGFVAGNWKMHNTLAEARELMKGLREALPKELPVDVAVCPPFTLLYPMGREIDGTAIKLGAQNTHFEAKGAFTGELSPAMLKAAGCTYVIIGHSERRQHFGERGDVLRRKVTAALAAGLGVIYCVGETLGERDARMTMGVVGGQLNEALVKEMDASRVTVAYEPVWAIGTGRNATPEQAQEVHAFIRSRLALTFGPEAAGGMRIQYGGSVKPDNAAALMGCPDVDGALVGGASLVAGDFARIIEIAGTEARRHKGTQGEGTKGQRDEEADRR